MITCQHARQLFDRYLDGELSPSLQAELHAHQLSCSACQTELAMLEACGDVIMLDRRREPKLTDSFTDRVLMAHRAQVASQPRRRNLGRTVVLFGSPLAAAASIALVLTLMWPTAQQRPLPAVLGGPDAVSEPPPAVKRLIEVGTTSQSTHQDQSLPTTQLPTSSFMESLLTSIVERTSQTVEGTKSNLSHLEMLLQQAVAETKAQLAADEDGSLRKSSASDRPPERQPGERDLLGPVSPNSENSNDSGSDVLLDPI